MMKRLVRMGPVLAVLAGLLLAADPATNLSGEWTGTIDVHDTDSGAVVSTNVRLSLTQAEASISGKIGRDGDAEVAAIQNARVDGDKLYFEQATIAHCGGLMLARIDGKSPAEYIKGEALKDRIRAFARRLITGVPATIEEVWHLRITA